MLRRLAVAVAVVVAFVGVTAASIRCEEASDSPRRTYYAVEMGGTVLGYAEDCDQDTEYEGREAWLFVSEATMKFTLLGAPVDQSIRTTTYVDESSGVPFLHEMTVEVGPTKQRVECVFQGGEAKCRTYVNDALARETTVPIGPDVIVLWDNHVLAWRGPAATSGETGRKHKVRFFVPMLSAVSDGTLEFKGEEQVDVGGADVPAWRYALDMDVMGQKIEMETWVVPDAQRAVRTHVADRGLLIYVTDPDVVHTFKRAELTDEIFARTSTLIRDFKSISRMRVEARLRAAGGDVSVESLNFGRQTFEGTVEDGTVKGVFEVDVRYYDGTGAPAFPPDGVVADELVEYAQPAPAIESDHPDIVALAAQVTEGATNSWEAAVRLAEWVDVNVADAIPGGSTALGTLQSLKGECGSHTRLHVALCRAAGVPARMAIGGTYVPIYGGAFGQHAWSEVYMGPDAGWVGVDAALGEHDYIDAGHIRLGLMSQFRPDEMTIPDYELKKRERSLGQVLSRGFRSWLGALEQAAQSAEQ
jgi:hypothetical protein